MVWEDLIFSDSKNTVTSLCSIFFILIYIFKVNKIHTSKECILPSVSVSSINTVGSSTLFNVLKTKRVNYCTYMCLHYLSSSLCLLVLLVWSAVAQLVEH